MDRRKFIVGLMASPLVAIWAKVLPAVPHRTLTQINYCDSFPLLPVESVYGGPTLAECKKKFTDQQLFSGQHSIQPRYAYAWRVEDGQMRDFTAVPEIDGKFTFPHSAVGWNYVMPGPKGQPNTWIDAGGNIVFPFNDPNCDVEPSLKRL